MLTMGLSQCSSLISQLGPNFPQKVIGHDEQEASDLLVWGRIEIISTVLVARLAPGAKREKVQNLTTLLTQALVSLRSLFVPGS